MHCSNLWCLPGSEIAATAYNLLFWITRSRKRGHWWGNLLFPTYKSQHVTSAMSLRTVSKRDVDASSNERRSELLNIKKGVPQGSIFGPFLFSIFINDRFMFLESNCLDNYADDNTVSMHHCQQTQRLRAIETANITWPACRGSPVCGVFSASAILLGGGGGGGGSSTSC